jgi:integrase
MPIRRQAILTPTQEITLAQKLEPLWSQGLSAAEIAYELTFGRGEYSMLKRYHVWFYRQKFDRAEYHWLIPFKGHFPRRKKGIRPGHSRYADKFEEVLPHREFKLLLNKNLSKDEDDEEVMMNRAYCILQYWTPLRKSELLERLRKDFKVKEDCLVITLYRKKKHYAPNAKPEPCNLLLSLPYVDEVVEYLESFKANEKVFAKLTPTKAWGLTKKVFEDRYPHFFRYNFITKAVRNAENARTIIAELLDDTRMDVSTVTGYVMASPKHRAAIARRELAQIQQEAEA